MRKPRTSVLVVEVHPLMRDALCTALADESGLAVTAQAASAAEAAFIVETSRPDIILFSLADPGPGFLMPLETLHRAFPTIPILALTASDIPEQENAVRASGAQRVLNKAASRQELLQALRSIRSNR